MNTTACPGCGVVLPAVDGPTHRYIGASPACWALYTALNNAGEPPLAPAAVNGLLTDAYAAQHPGVPSPQAIQSVAVHLLTLYGVLVAGVDPGRVLWLRQATLRDRARDPVPRFVWLTPPSFAATLTVAGIVAGPTPQARTGLVRRYVDDVWAAWSPHHATVAAWYARVF
jgi:hypothetical protein